MCCGDLKSDHSKSGLFKGQISNVPFFKWSGFICGYSFSPNHLKTVLFKIWMFLSRFQMVFDKVPPICSDFKWLGFRISDPIRNLDHFATQPLFHHSKSRLVRISDPHCISKSPKSLVCGRGFVLHWIIIPTYNMFVNCYCYVR